MVTWVRRRPGGTVKEDEHENAIRIASEGENAKKGIHRLSFAGNNFASRPPQQQPIRPAVSTARAGSADCSTATASGPRLPGAPNQCHRSGGTRLRVLCPARFDSNLGAIGASAAGSWRPGGLNCREQPFVTGGFGAVTEVGDEGGHGVSESSARGDTGRDTFAWRRGENMGSVPGSWLNRTGSSRRANPLLPLWGHSRAGGAAMPRAPTALDNRRKRGSRVAMTWREFQRTMEEREHAYYGDIIRRYPWPVVAIRAASPVAVPTMGAAASLCRRCRRVA